MTWTLEWSSRARKDLRKLDGQTPARIIDAIGRYAQSGSGDVRQLTDVDPPEHRLRVGSWRVRFRRDPGRTSIIVLRVLPRDKAY